MRIEKNDYSEIEKLEKCVTESQVKTIVHKLHDRTLKVILKLAKNEQAYRAGIRHRSG